MAALPMNAFANAGGTLLEVRDHVAAAKDWYYDPARIECRKLRSEVVKYKSLLLENGIEPSSGQKMMDIDIDTNNVQRLPSLPMETLSRIMEFSLTSNTPVINPLHHKERESMAADEYNQKNTFNLALLATCRAFHARGTSIFWGKNTFTFTNPAAAVHFATLPLQFRALIKRVELRIVARYYAADSSRTTVTGSSSLYWAPHPSYGNGDISVILPTVSRDRIETLARRPFSCYAWTQIEDFLSALRAPYDPSLDIPALRAEIRNMMDNNNKNSNGMTTKVVKRPRPALASPIAGGSIHDPFPRPVLLLPNLLHLRIDFVDFPPNLLSTHPNTRLFHLARDYLGQWLPQLRLTGLPRGEMSATLSEELGCMLRDDGVLLMSDTTFFHDGWFTWGGAGGALPLFRMEELNRNGDVYWEPEWIGRVRNPHRVLNDAYKRRVQLRARDGGNGSGGRGQGGGDDSDGEDSDFGMEHNQDETNYLETDGVVRPMAAVPLAAGRPSSMWRKRKTVFKKLPARQDSEVEKWVEFDRIKNRKLEVEEYDSGDDYYYERDWVCRKCDVIHRFRDEEEVSSY